MTKTPDDAGIYEHGSTQGARSYTYEEWTAMYGAPDPEEVRRAEESARRAEERARRANGHAGAGGRRFHLVRFGDVKLSTDAAYLVKDLIPREGLVVVWGAPKCGKSFFVFDLLLHVALGWPYRGHKVTKAPIVYVACEGERGLAARVAAFKHKHAIADADFHLVTTRLDLVADRDELVADIRAQLGDEVEIGAIAIDTLNRSIAGSESDDEAMGNYIKAADTVREAFACAIVVIHHCGIDAKRPRGHTSLTGAVDAQLAVKRADDGQITTTVEFMKDGEEGQAIVSRLEVVPVGVDQEGDPITSCVVVPEDGDGAAPSPRRPKLTPTAKRFLDALHTAIVDHGAYPVDKRNCPTRKMVSLQLWEKQAARAGATEGATTDRSRAAMTSKYRKELLDKGVIAMLDGQVWLVATACN